MKRMNGLLVGGLTVGLLQSVVVAEPVVSLEIRSKNGEVIPGGPVTTVNAVPNDMLELVFRVRDWNTAEGEPELRGYQTSIVYGDYLSGTSGDVLPIDFDITDPDGECPGIPNGGNNLVNVFIDTARPDFVFPSGTVFVAVDTSGCNYRWAGALMIGAVPGTTGVRKYAGSLLVRVSADASGTFTLNPNPDSKDGTFLRNVLDLPIEPVSFEGCTIVTPGVISIVSSEPAHDSIDARQPHPINNSAARQGWDQLTVTFSGPTAGLTAADFTVSVEPTGGVVPSISGVGTDQNAALVLLNQVIPAGKWTRITHNDSGTSVRIGALPADVNGDRTSSPVDILRIIDHLNGVQNYPIFRTDADRSGVANPADILRVIDLLNGADQFEVWNGKTLPN